MGIRAVTVDDFLSWSGVYMCRIVHVKTLSANVTAPHHATLYVVDHARHQRRWELA